MSKVKECDDCEDPVLTRRTKCKTCGLLLCRYCYHHYHAAPFCTSNDTKEAA